jgi:hypothetical protein
LQWREIVAIAAQLKHLATAPAELEILERPVDFMHKPPLHIAGNRPVPAQIHYHRIARHFRTSTHRSVFDRRNRHALRESASVKFFIGDVENSSSAPTTS